MAQANDAARASFALAVGGVAVLGGALSRLLDVPRWPGSWVATAVGVMAACALAWTLTRPRRGQLGALGASPLAALLGVAMAVWAALDPARGPFLWPSAVAAIGGATTLAALTRWAMAAGARVSLRAPVDPAHRYGVVREGQARLAMTPAKDIAAGDRVEVPPGQRLPTDGVLLEGEGFADERALTGVELAVSKDVGDPVIAGSTFDGPITYRATAPAVASVVARLHEHHRALLEAVAHEGQATSGRALALAIALGSAAAAAVLLVLAGGSRGLPAAAGALLGLSAAAGLVSSRLALCRAITDAIRSGAVPARALHAAALGRARRWQADVGVLAPSSRVEVLGEADDVLGVARALVDGPSPEARAIARAARQKKLTVPAAAATRRGAGTWHGTVRGERWCVGPAAAVAEEARVKAPAAMASGLAYLGERAAAVWWVARTDEAVVGALGVELRVDGDVAAAARALGATVMPGPPDALRAHVASAAELVRDGPPLRRRDATLLAPGSAGPSAGLVVEVREPSADARWDADVTCWSSSVPTLPALIERLRGRRRAARVSTALALLVPALLVVPLALAQALDPVLGTLAGVASVLLAARRGPPQRTSRGSTQRA